MRLIDADALLKVANENFFSDAVANVEYLISLVPAIDPQSLRATGEWVIQERRTFSKNPCMEDTYYASAICSECGFCIQAGSESFGYPRLHTTNFCPNCGAKMKGEN